MGMRTNVAAVSAMAALALMLALPAAARAQTWNSTGTNSQNVGPNQNMAMVGTRGAMVNTLDAKNAKQGQTFQVKLADKAKLADGQVYPKGTVLIGKVTTDDMNQPGNTKLALSIDQAKMKDGSTRPVHAYIVGLFPAGGGAEAQAQAETPGNQDPNPWRRGIQKVDQIDALHGVDLHSKIGDGDSAVLVSKKDDIKLKPGTELALVISEGSGNSSMNSNSGQTGGTGGGR